jgi:dTDP-4-amino-4,6-dideoxygalactose transaminase
MSNMSTTEQIPFLDLVTPHKELEDKLLSILKDTLSTAGFVGGPKVDEFERDFAKFCDATHCVGVASGTDAVRFALTAAGVKAGDIVVTVPHTFIATTEAISQAGARPDFVDIDERTYCMDPRKLQEYLEHHCFLDAATGKLMHRKLQAPVTAIVPVHIYGQTADMDLILDLAHKYNLIVIEDACQAHGAEYFSKKSNSWRKAGSMGHAAAFSFYPGKNLGACGEAGAITTNNEAMARTMRILRDHGQAQKYYHQIEGYNGRLDALQAGFLSTKLPHLAKWNRDRQQAAKLYDQALAGIAGVVAPFCPDSAHSVYHLYVIRVSDRNALQQHLAKNGIGTGIHYPVPLHLQEAYRHLQYPAGSFPVCERVASEILSLPMFPQLRSDQSQRVVREVAAFLSPRRATPNVEQVQPVAL